jgi:murein DD-endopeptidase MepM/ murein hydrolase activator NlpD
MPSGPRRRLAVPLGALVSSSLLIAVATGQDDGGAPPAAQASATARASATAFVGTARTRGTVSVAGRGSRSASAAAVGRDLSGSATARVRAAPGSASASVSARDVSAFGGLVQAAQVTWTASARNGATRWAGRVVGLVVDGAGKGSRSSAGTYRTRDVTVRVLSGAGLVVTLRRAHAGYSAGATVAVGRAAASAPRPPAAKPKPKPKPKSKRPAAAKPEPAAPRSGGTAKDAPGTPPAATTRRKAAKARAHAKRRARPKPALTDDRYTFPVLSRRATASDGFGAPRQIGAHRGNDIFAPFGAPVVAVHDGTLNRVGTLPISGNRLWLKAPGGDAFFYAHLSAFSPAAVSGAHVKAGTILGFVGNTGDAEPTPPHLHFEIHPQDGDAVDPYPFLLAWQRHEDAPGGAWEDTAERPGTLVQTRDFIAR